MDEIKELPKSAFSFYLKLYCSRKAETNSQCENIIKEAKQSWVSLKNSEKQVILKNYDEYLKKSKRIIADYLKNAEPYLKLKEPKINRKRVQNLENDQTERNLEINHSKCESTPDLNVDEDNEKNVTSESYNNTKLEADDCNQHILMNFSSPKTVTTPFPNIHDTAIPEPPPPKLLTGKELFEILNERQESNLRWDKLTKSQKDPYRRAVLTIKKKYLAEYKIYLEHLPPEKLYKHYRNIVNSL